MMSAIRPAKPEDLARIAEIEIFNYRLNFYPIFRYDPFYFEELQVPSRMEYYRPLLNALWVYDDGVVKGFFQAEGRELKKLFVEPVRLGKAIGAALLEHAVSVLRVNCLWALEKNTRAIAFYQRHGFGLTGQRKPEDGTEEHLVQLIRP